MIKNKELKSAILFLLPTLIIIIPFAIIPFFLSFGLSLFNYPILKNPTFIGFKNYIEMFSDKIFIVSLKNTILYMLGTIPFRMFIGLFLAILVNKKFVGRNLLRTLLYFPYIAPLVSVSVLWRWLMDYNYGVINATLNLLGIASIPWLESPDIALCSIMIMSIWKTVGWNMVIFLAALQGIPTYLYESAKIDGASHLRQFISITLPLMKPVFLLTTVISLINSSQVFEQVFVMTNGGPGYATMTLVQHVYRSGFQNYKMGYASAIGVSLFIIVGILALFQFKILGEKVEY